MSRLHWINISTFASLAMIILNDYFNRIELLVFWWNEINNRCYIVHQEIIKRFSYGLLQKNLTTFSILRFCKKGQFWLSKFAKWPFIQLQSHDEFFEWIVAKTFCTFFSWRTFLMETKGFVECKSVSWKNRKIP